VNREFIREGNDPQEAITELWHGSPEPESIVLLRFDTKGRLDDPDAHLPSEIGQFPDN
jgi:hypothetical protein